MTLSNRIRRVLGRGWIPSAGAQVNGAPTSPVQRAMPFLLPLALLAVAQVPVSQCVTAYGQTRCGYACTAEFGDVQCARTALGVCVAAGGRVHCWDPADDVVRAYSTQRAPAECRTAYGMTACGWACRDAFGDVKCAATPAGTCMEAGGRVSCFDPRVPLPPPVAVQSQCITQFGVTACGYGCMAALGQVRCARTPQGSCREVAGVVRCSDP